MNTSLKCWRRKQPTSWNHCASKSARFARNRCTSASICSWSTKSRNSSTRSQQVSRSRLSRAWANSTRAWSLKISCANAAYRRCRRDGWGSSIGSCRSPAGSGD
uniref:Uncharacterized protein n=1 Tax=Spironucleus salmonicida TaxID=348837 RepID=V6LJU7_9EUKA|eukprot:EST44648.1 Hypothetical protein SS50377_15657 [Spironucleus salmonicida]